MSLTSNAKTIDADSLIIRFMSWNMEGTPHTITCSGFEYDVPFKEFTITDKLKIESLSIAINSSPRINDAQFSVGCKLLFVKNDKVVEVVCMDGKHSLQNGKMYLSSTEAIKIIDGIIESMPENSNIFYYKPGRYGDEYIYGRESLYQCLNFYMDKLKLKNQVIITTHIKAKKNGKTTKIMDMNVYSKDMTYEDKSRIGKEMKRVLMNKIKWKKDPNRMENDFITINYKYIPQ